MGTNRSADIIDENFAVKMRETLFNQISHGSGVFVAGRLGDIAFAVVCGSFFQTFFHFIDDGVNDLALGADLVAGNQPPQMIHIQKGADIQHTADKAGGFGNAAATDVEGQVSRKEPVVEFQTVLYSPVI